MRKQTVVLSVTNDFTADQRVQRIANYLVMSGFEVVVVGRNLPNSLPLDTFPYEVYRMNLFFKKGKFFYLEYQIRLFFKLFFLSATIFTANDLDTLLPNFLVAKWHKKRLIYDTHEYFTQVPELIHRPFTQKIWLTLEQWLFPKLQTVMTVNESLVKIYEGLYPVRVRAIYNVPTQKALLQEKITKPKVLIYQGALNVDRGLELMIETMRYLPNYELWIVGRGDVEENLRKLPVPLQNVVFKGFFKPQELYLLTQQASLGLSLEKAEALNYVYASPNKVFDYIQAEVPVLVSDFPENQKLIQAHAVGEIVPLAKQNPHDLAQIIRGICENETLYAQYVAACKAARKVLCWEMEARKLATIYGKMEKQKVVVYWADIENILAKGNWKEKLQGVPEESKQKAAGYHFEIDQLRHLLGRWLLNKGAKELYGVTNASSLLKYSIYGKPFLPDSFEFSISHSGKYVLCAFSTKPVGIDVEAKVEGIFDAELMGDSFTTQELAYIQKNGDVELAFHQFWTAKEAALKCVGIGLVDNLWEAECFMNEKVVRYEKQNYYFQPYNLDELHCVSVASETLFETEWVEVLL